MTKIKKYLKEDGAMTTGPAIVGTNTSDPSAPLAPRLGLVSRARKMIDAMMVLLQRRKEKRGTTKSV